MALSGNQLTRISRYGVPMAAYPFQRRLGQLVEVAALCILSAVSGAVDIFAKVIGRTPISSATGAEVSVDPSVAGTVTTEGE